MSCTTLPLNPGTVDPEEVRCVPAHSRNNKADCQNVKPSTGEQKHSCSGMFARNRKLSCEAPAHLAFRHVRRARLVNRTRVLLHKRSIAKIASGEFTRHAEQVARCLATSTCFCALREWILVWHVQSAVECKVTRGQQRPSLGPLPEPRLIRSD